MLVSELIEKLKHVPQDYPVLNHLFHGATSVVECESRYGVKYIGIRYEDHNTDLKHPTSTDSCVCGHGREMHEHYSGRVVCYASGCLCSNFQTTYRTTT